MKIKIWVVEDIICLQFIKIDKLRKYIAGNLDGIVYRGRYFQFRSEMYPAISRKIFNLPGTSNRNFIPFYIKIDNDYDRTLFLNKLEEDINSFGEFLNK